MIYRADILTTTSIAVEVEADCPQDARDRIERNVGTVIGDAVFHDSLVANLIGVVQEQAGGDSDE